jgi:hypothetical protein
MIALSSLQISTPAPVAFAVPLLALWPDGRISTVHRLGASMFLLSLVVTAFVVVTGLARRRRRLRAWPDALHILAEPPGDGPALRYGIGVLSAVILLAGCAQIVLPWTAPAAILAGTSALVLARREWNENLADVGLALITLGVTSLVVICFPALPTWWTALAWAEVFNRILLGLTIMAGLWYWLAGVWRQQLDKGQAWTTAGRLIRTSERVGFFVAALAVLIAYHLAFWPSLPYGSLDADAWRWGWGLAANGLLILVLLWIALTTHKSAAGWLFAFAVFAMVMFVTLRTPHGFPGQIWASYWPVVLAVMSCVLVVLASLLARTERGQPLFEPVYMAGVVITPLTSIAGILYSDPRTMPRWAPPMAFGGLLSSYLLAALLVGPRTFVAVSVLCAGLCFWRLQDATGWMQIAMPYYYAMLICLASGLWAWVVLRRHPSRLMRVIMWVGFTMAVVSILGGWLLSEAQG